MTRNSKILLIASPNFSIKMLEEEILNLKSGNCDFTKSVDWRPAAPLGLLYIAGALKQAGYNVRIHDLHRAFYICRETGYFKEKSLSNFFEDHFENIIRATEIDILGVSCLFNVASTTVDEIASRCKRVSPDTRIILGGYYPTVMYREILKSAVCDYVILGEAEEEFVWLLNHIKDPLIDQKVNDNPHIVDLKCIDKINKKSDIIEKPDNLPMPAWDLLPHAIDYIENSIDAERVGSSMGEKKVKSAAIFTTRGCPMRCTFCAAHSVHGRVIRAHSIEYVMKHIDWLVDNYDINNLLIQDDMFNFSTKRTINFCRILSQKYNNRFTIEFPNGLAVWNLSEEVIAHFKKAGLKSVTLGIESGDRYVQKYIIKKNLDLSMVRQKVELFKKHNIGVRAFYVIGFIGETLQMMQDTVRFALDLNIDWSEIKVFTPLVGSEMYDVARKKGYLIGDTSEHVYRRCSIQTPEFTPEDVENLQYDGNIRVNFLNNRNLREGKFGAAEQLFSKLLMVYPNHLFAQWGLWQALKGQEKKEEAEKALERLQELANESEKAHILLEKYRIKLPYIAKAKS